MTDFSLLFGLLILGAIAGSFIGALTYRLPRKVSIAKGRSICDFCRKKISWYDNIPVLSYVLLDGKCRNCHKKISLRYPAIELATAIGFIGIGYFSSTLKGQSLQGWWALPYLLTVFSILVAIFVIDLEHQLIPDNLVFFLLVITYSLLLITSAPDLYVRVASGFAAALFLLFIHLITRGRGMGLGDVKFALLGGTILGFPNTLVFLFLSFLTGAGVGIILILIKRARFGKPIPFGPYLVFGVTAALLFGDYLLKKWLQ